MSVDFSWSFEKADNNIFLLILGERALNEAGEECGAIKTVDPGRSGDELWFTVCGSKNGKRLKRSQYHSRNGFLQNLNGSRSNCEFIDHLVKEGIRRKTKKSKSTKRPSSEELIAIPGPEEPNVLEEVIFCSQKCIGEFKVDISTLKCAPPLYRCREIVPEWVDSIIENIKMAPIGIFTVLPVLVQQNSDETPNYQTCDKILLGGNHLITAIKKILDEKPEEELFSEYKKVHVYVYTDLSPEEAKLVGNNHNSSTTTLKMTFQTMVIQARDIFLKEIDDWKDVVVKTFGLIHHRKDKNYYTLLWSIVTLPDAAFDEVIRIMNMWSKVYNDKDCPQRIFRALQGLPTEVKVSYLRKIQKIGDINEVCVKIEREKKMSLLKELFCKEMGCVSFEQAEDIYFEHFHGLDRFLDLKIVHGKLPEIFVDYCKSAENFQDLSEITVNINVTYGNHQIRNAELDQILDKYTRKIKQEIISKKIKLNSEE